MHSSVCSTKQQQQSTLSMFFQKQHFLKCFVHHTLAVWTSDNARKLKEAAKVKRRSTGADEGKIALK